MSDLKQLDDSLGIINDNDDDNNDNDSKEWDNISNITDINDDNNDDNISTSPVINKDNYNNNNDNDNNNEMILISLANDANDLVENGDINQAINVYNDLIERYEIYYGQNHPSIIDFAMILSDLYCTIGKFNNAFILKEKGLRLQQKLLGQANPIFIDILNSLIWMTYMAQDFRSMIKFFDEMINYTRVFEIDNSEFAINMFNLIDQYENDGNIINIEQIISILEYITEIVFMSRGNHDSNTMIVKEKLAYKLKIQADLVYQRYQTIMQSSEWTDGEIDDIALILENTIMTNEIDEIIESIIPEMSTYLTENINVIQDTVSMVKQDDINMVDGIRMFTLDDIIDVGDEYVEEKVQDTFPKTNDKKSRQPYIRQNRTGLEDMQNILADMKKKEILPEDDNMFEGAFELIINDTSDANVDITDDGDPREFLVVNEHIQGRVDMTGEKYLYRIFPYDISEAAQKYLYMKNFNPKYYGKTFEFSLFPPMIGEINGERDWRYKKRFIIFSQLASSMRVKRLMLLEDLDTIKADMSKFKDMLAQVAKKKENRTHRIHLLEHELTEMIPEDPSLPHHRFNALLSIKEGWHIVISHINRQYKRLLEDSEIQEKPEVLVETTAAPNDEEIDTNLTLDDTIKAAYYLQVVQLLRTIEQFSRTGVKPEAKHHQKQLKKKDSKDESIQIESINDQNDDQLKRINILEDKKLTFSMGQDAVVGDFNSALILMGATPHPKKTLKSTLNDLHGFITHDEFLVSNQVIAKPVLNELALAVYETQETEEHSEFVAVNLSKVADCLTKEIEKILISSLRMLTTWPKMLEKYRKERLRRIGQKMTKIADDVEVDKQGSVRVIPNADEVIDTDIFHGAMQRMHINVIEPEAKKRIQLMKGKREVVKCELASLCQFFYLYSSVFTQKCSRGLIVRRQAYHERRALVYQAMHAAACSIQAWVKAIKGKKTFAAFCATLADNVKVNATIKLQAFMRMWTKWHKYYLQTKDRKDRKIRWGVTKVQSVIRRYNARCRVLRMRGRNSEQLHQEVSEWGIVQIQKLVRGFVARKTIVRSLHIRNSIAPEVLTLAEKYLKKGNLWNFLKEIDFIMKHYQSDLTEMESREDKYASTFVQKVLVQRQGQFDGAWNRFSKSALSHDRGSSTNMADGDGKLSAIAQDSGNIEWTNKSSAHDSNKNSNKSVRTSTLDQSIPGPMLRRAVTATIKEGVKQEFKSNANDVSRSVKLANNIKKVYGSNSSEIKVKKKSTKSIKNSISGSNSITGSISMGSQVTRDCSPVRSSHSPTRTIINNNESKVIGANATSVDWVGAFNNGISSPNNSGFKLSPVKKSQNKERLFFSGESLLIDIPKGVNDSLERLFNAAAIRCYVPTFFANEDKEKAYSIYLQMPVGLPKLKYEQEAFKMSQPILNQFNQLGLSKIQDVMPLSKFKTFMKNYKTPLLLLNTTVDIFYSLQKMGDFAVGKPHETSQKQNNLFQEDKATLGQTVSAIESNIIENMINDNSSPGNHKIKYKKDEDIDPTQPSRLLLSMVESGPWASLKATVEDLITHAAYVIVEHKRNIPHTNKFEIIETGHNAFKAHAHDLQLMSEDDKKEAIKNRFRSALIMSTPYYLKLKAEGVLLVEDLLKVDFSSLNMPPMLQKQVEALLNVAVYSATNAKAAFTVRDHLSTSKEMFTIPMLYDPKFQRSPFDPYGRQPRFNALQKLIKLRTKEENKKIKQDKQRKKETPKGLWENMNNEEENRDTDELIKNKKSFYNFKEVPQSQDSHFASHSQVNNHDATENMSSIQSVSLQSNQDFNTSVQSYTSLESDTSKLVSPIIRAKSKQNTRIKYDKKNIEDGTRPYICTEPNCGAAFSRLYTLKIHQKSHNLFANYHAFKRDPQLYLDPDTEDILVQKNKEYERSYSLSDVILQELNNLEQGYGVDTPVFPPIPYNFSRESNRSRNTKSRTATRGSSRGTN